MCRKNRNNNEFVELSKTFNFDIEVGNFLLYGISKYYFPNLEFTNKELQKIFMQMYNNNVNKYYINYFIFYSQNTNQLLNLNNQEIFQILNDKGINTSSIEEAKRLRNTFIFNNKRKIENNKVTKNRNHNSQKSKEQKEKPKDKKTSSQKNNIMIQESRHSFHKQLLPNQVGSSLIV